MASVRLSPRTQARLKKAAKLTKIPASELMRQGIEDRLADVLDPSLAERLAPCIGVVRSSGKAMSGKHAIKQELDSVMHAKLTRNPRRKAG